MQGAQFQTLRQTLQAIRALGLSARITPYGEIRIALKYPPSMGRGASEVSAYYADVRDADGRADAIATAHAMAKEMRPVCRECHGEPEQFEYTACGETDCPHREPLHYHHDGCPACYEGTA